MLTKNSVDLKKEKIFLNSNHKKNYKKKLNEELLEHLKYSGSGLPYFTIGIIVSESSIGERVRTKSDLVLFKEAN